ncbi:MAG: dTDP-4-dehydrorhamnose reductase [candidate division WOR-3 bacterium]
MKKVLVTGSGGLLGRELMRFLEATGEPVTGWDLPEHDITRIEECINAIHEENPEVIFHLAAWTDVDGCEAEPARALAVNFQGTWAVALGAAETGCKLVYLSTDYVFDGRKRKPYRESDKPNPLSVYGRSKYLGEQVVMKNCRRYFIVRTSRLFGRHDRNFVNTILSRAKVDDELRVVNDQTGSPTYAKDLCLPLVRLARSEHYGIYHLTNSGQCTWFEFAREIVRLAGLNCEVIPITTAESGRRAPRPAYSVLDNHHYRRRFGLELRPWQEALRSYLDEIQAAETGG